MNTWTVVTRKAGRGQFRKTGFAGTWQEATEEAARLAADETLEVWYVDADDTRILLDSGRWVGIAPTADERRAAKAHKAAIDAAVNDMLAADWLRDYLRGDARALLGYETTFRSDAARALAEAGWTRAKLGIRHS